MIFKKDVCIFYLWFNVGFGFGGVLGGMVGGGGVSFIFFIIMRVFSGVSFRKVKFSLFFLLDY